MHGANTIVDPRVKTSQERHSWETNKKKYINKSLSRIFRAINNDHIGICTRFEEMTANHRFELQSETKDNHQQSRKLKKCPS